MELDNNWNRIVASIEKATHLREIARYELAERTLREALIDAPESPDLHLHLGYVFEAQDRYDEAATCARDALGCDPNEAYALALLGDIASKSGRNVEAEKHYLAALQLGPNNADFLRRYSHLMFSVAQLDKAEGLIRAALEVEPDNPDGHSLLSLILTEQRQGGSAQAAGQTGLQVAPDRDVQHVSLGLAYYHRGRPRKARHHLREALRLDPDDSDTEELYHEVDRLCRWTALPYYYWSLLVDRLPGGPFAIWGAFLLSYYAMKHLGVSDSVLMWFSLSYLAFIIYTWLATPLTRAWIRLVPAR